MKQRVSMILQLQIVNRIFMRRLSAVTLWSLKWGIVVSVLIFMSRSGSAQGTNPGKNKEQSAFSSEEKSVDKPAILPADAIEAIRKTDQHNYEQHEITGNDLVASEIHLDGNGEMGLIVVGVGINLRGAHLVPFWILRRTNQGYEVLLSTGGDDLFVLPKKWRGYRVIEVVNLIAGRAYVATYKYDGTQYRQVKNISSPIH
jgi:hypothetical protein